MTNLRRISDALKSIRAALVVLEGELMQEAAKKASKPPVRIRKGQRWRSRYGSVCIVLKARIAGEFAVVQFDTGGRLGCGPEQNIGREVLVKEYKLLKDFQC